MSNQAGGMDICHQHLATMHTASSKELMMGGCSGGDRKNSFWGKSCVWQTKIMNKRLLYESFLILATMGRENTFTLVLYVAFLNL